MIKENLQKHTIESEESILNIGFSQPKETVYYDLKEAEQRELFISNPVIGGYSFGGSSVVTEHKRSVYTVLSLLGDIGGLFDALIYLGHFMFMMTAGGNLDWFIISKLFYKRERHSGKTFNAGRLAHVLPTQVG